MKKATLINNYIKIEFTFSFDMLNHVKALPGKKKYNPNGKYWVNQLNILAVKRLKNLGFELDNDLQSYISSQTKSKLSTKVTCPELDKKLYPFQKQGINYIFKKNGSALIADDMGLGKTIQALGWLRLNPQYPVLIICPSCVKYNWANEIQKWIKTNSIQILSGRDSSSTTLNEDFIIINYDILADWRAKLSLINFQVLILDEGHYIKNNKAKRTKAAKKIAKHIPNKLVLTGTPILNRPIEIFNAVNLIDPNLFQSYWHFAQRYCDAKHTGFGWDFNGSSNTEELHEILTNSVMIRRLKKDVLKELPDKTYSFIPMEIDNVKEYKQAESDFIKFTKQTIQKEMRKKLSEIKAKYGMAFEMDKKLLHEIQMKQLGKINILTQMEKLKQIAVKGKLKQIKQWITDTLETTDKLIVYTTHKFTVDYLQNEFPKISVKIDGSVDAQQKQLIADKFQKSKKIKLLIGNIKAAGVGMNLTAAYNVAFIELPDTPGDLNQAIDRVHRITQKNKVNVYYLLAKDTIEEKIAHRLDEKRKIIEQILDGKQHKETPLFADLLQNMIFN